MAKVRRKSIERPSTIVGAIDAGSNAIRATVARIEPDGHVQVLAQKRCAVRLGHQVFTEGHIPPTRANEAAEAFVKFRQLFDKHGVESYRAVATSAMRNARNKRSVLNKIKGSSGLELTPISGIEEAELVRHAVLQQFPKSKTPQLIADLGGGSLELSLLCKQGRLVDSTSLPIGTVRLMEDRELYGRIRGGDYKELKALIAERLCSWRPELRVKGNVALCGGNARAWARIAEGTRLGALATIDTRKMKEELRQARRMSIDERRRAYDVRQDRAEVMVIAGVVFRCLSSWLDNKRFVVPSAGLRDGLLRQMSESRDELLALSA